MSKEKIGNKFGKGIEFREGSPIQLLSYSEKSENEKFGQILLNPEALNILREINEPLAIISVVGSFRRGKSWFANVLHGRHDGFDLGANVEGCTRGIYMWSPPFKLTSEQPNGKTIQKRVLVLDSEGIDDPSRDENWATKLFILCLVISSTFVYNINGVVGREHIGKLHLMTDLSNFIKEPEYGDFLPRLVILLRDFNLETPDSFKDYFLKQMNHINTDAAAAIRRFFCDFDVYGLSQPGCRKKLLQHMENVKTDDLDEEFVEEVVKAVKSIYSQLPLKYIGSSTMQGISFVKFLENIVERMNISETSILLSIPSEYEFIVQFVAQEAIKESVEKYKERMNTLINEEGKLPMLWEEFERMHHEYISEVNKIFFAKIIGRPTQISNFAVQLNKETFKFKEELMEKNSKELTIYNENIAKVLWEKYIGIGLNDNENKSFKDIEEFQEALGLFESDYNESMKKSPEATKIFASYKKNQYPLAINHVTQVGATSTAETMYAKEEADRLRLETEAREEILRLEIEALKRERDAYETNANKKILELQTNIEQQKKSQEEMRQRFIKEKDCTIEEYKYKFEEIEKMNEDNKKIITEYRDKIDILTLGSNQLEAEIIQLRIEIQKKEKLLNNGNNKRKLSCIFI
ncbi:GBP-domain-containing protein [Rhizophagus irregularis]|uniref:GBP-domain-containing protein n=1 Tax=Rhizophagus irregularis TaxID=588596 RepID=A0A2I1H6J1_9GLOM|nr:GBP-domain-containing protein [Rhizophagus irregularis]